MRIQPEQYKWRKCTKGALLACGLSIFTNISAAMLFAKTQQGSPQTETHQLNVSASFASKEAVAQTELIGLRLTRPLQASEGTLAVFVGQTDITSLFNSTEKGLNYSAQALPLPVGENTLFVYLVSLDGSWQEVAQFPLRVKDAKRAGQVQDDAANTTRESNKHGFDKFEIKPSLTLNLKTESTLLFFPIRIALTA